MGGLGNRIKGASLTSSYIDRSVSFNNCFSFVFNHGTITNRICADPDVLR